MQGAIQQRWNTLGGAGGVLGPHLTCELPTTDDTGRLTHFQSGSIYWSPATGAWDVRGLIGQRWSTLGAERSWLRYPTTGETPVRGGAFTHFQGGSIYFSPTTGAREVRGAIREGWGRLGWENGYLGYPVSDEKNTGSFRGAYQDFQGGTMYWAPWSGAHALKGDIRDTYATEYPGEDLLGFPTTSEIRTPNARGAYNHFERGSIYWTPTYGAHPLWGQIRDIWATQGWENSRLGFPISGPLSSFGSDLEFQIFQGGVINWWPGGHHIEYN
ncbi:hypothetical protein GTR00_05165 [Kineococcus sp. T90]|nr:hypothetical protein [Kineococcus indalonis]